MNDSRFTDYQRVLNAHENKRGEMEITVRFPTRRYMDEFIDLRCASDMLELGLFPNAKEITESFAAYRAACRFVPFDVSDKDVSVAVIGDGVSPRTAATFAFRSAWRCIAIDPQMRAGAKWKRINRLTTIAKKVEDVGRTAYKKLVIVAPHSHAPLEAALERLTAKERHVIALPCCVEQTVPGRSPDHAYDDWGIWSPQRAVRVWCNA